MSYTSQKPWNQKREISDHTHHVTVRASSPVLAISIFHFKNSFSLRVKHQEYLAVAGQDVDTEPLMLFTEVDVERVRAVRACCRAETFTNLVPSPSITQTFLGVRHSFLHHERRRTPENICVGGYCPSPRLSLLSFSERRHRKTRRTWGRGCSLPTCIDVHGLWN